MASRPERIAVIDDTDMVRTIVSRHLERLGFKTLQAEDGDVGLNVIRANKLELVLCDLRMPTMDGLEVLKTVKEEFPDLPVIVMSGEGLLEDAIGALKLGAWDYISKPIEPAVLEHAVKKALEKAVLIDENRRHRAHLEKLNRELKATLRLLAEDEDAGRQIQFRMLPRNHQHFGPYLFTRDVVPSAFLSGDFIDAFAIDQRHFGFYLADVSGHGVSSALVTVLLRTFVQRQVASFIQSGDALVLSPAKLLMRLNEEMAHDDLDKHLTMFYGIVDLVENSLLYANAGHFPWPILVDGDKVQLLEEPGVPVGVVSGTRYEEHRTPLGAQMSLAVFSDGVLEILPQPSLDEKLDFLKTFFGRLNVTVEQTREALNLSGNTSLPDDIAVLIIQRGGTHGDDAHS
ncbi:MAG TPA: fused response regulator/phosphatase [Polyangiaceae bacterium]|nr:fused response regulator/phosphatase [Polyangiaceae bacterium]